LLYHITEYAEHKIQHLVLVVLPSQVNKWNEHSCTGVNTNMDYLNRISNHLFPTCLPSRVALCVACWPKNSQVAGSNLYLLVQWVWRKSHSRCAAAADSFLTSCASRSYANSQYYTYNAFGRCRWHVCAFLPTIPLGVFTVPSSTRRMPEWILRPLPCIIPFRV
jgi:hypothetical protein